MTQPFNARDVIDQFLYATLSGDATLATLMPAGQIYPRVAPSSVTGIHIVHDFVGPDGGRMAVPVGRGVAQLEMLYSLVAWNTGYSLHALAPVTMRVQVLLVGDDLRGKTFAFVDAFGVGWSIGVIWAGPSMVPPEVNPTWQPSSELYRVQLRQKPA